MLEGEDGGSLIRLALLLALSLPATAQEGLRYRMQMWLRGETAPLETRFRLVATEGTTSHNRVKKPRMGGWRLEADRGQGTPYSQALLLGRAERLLYLAGPSPQTHAEPIALRFGPRSVPVWSLEMPKGLHASTVLVEVAPGLLALCDLSARFEQGDLARIELHLESLDGSGSLAPAEAGTVLLSTLRSWAQEARQDPEDGSTVR
ncbi:hypothetical protein [Geothrix terrae]|uniref:hypothetical protein n=1 Tax=Geothrix terrae TaxID=2922720 RepID=UPI001FABA92B|nr:hypothetical protein [Geothrix terrae]